MADTNSGNTAGTGAGTPPDPPAGNEPATAPGMEPGETTASVQRGNALTKWLGLDAWRTMSRGFTDSSTLAVMLSVVGVGALATGGAYAAWLVANTYGLQAYVRYPLMAGAAYVLSTVFAALASKATTPRTTTGTTPTQQQSAATQTPAKAKQPWRGFRETFARLLGLNVWGNFLRARALKKIQGWIANILVATAVIYLVVWFMTFQVFFAHYPWYVTTALSALMAYAVATMNLGLEVSIIMSDTSIDGFWPRVGMAARVVLALGLALVSSQPLELSLFHGDIEVQLDAKAAKVRDELLKTGKAEEVALFDRVIKSATAEQRAAIELIQSERDTGLQAITDRQSERRIENTMPRHSPVPSSIRRRWARVA